MPQNRPVPGELYRHFKNKMYQIVAVATHSETRESYVVYQALYGDFLTYVRPYDMFISEVDHKKYPEVTQTYRFEYVGTAAVTEEQQGKEEKTTVVSDEGTSGADPRLLAFLDADTYAQKLDIVTSMEEELDDHLVNQMAASMDVIVEDGPCKDRIEQLKRCIRTRLRYELSR